VPTRRRPRGGAVTAKVLSITGVKDPYVPVEDLDAFQREMTDAEVDWQVTVYGEGLHAFTMPDIAEHDVPGTAYDPLLDHLSWAQATTFLTATLPRGTRPVAHLSVASCTMTWCRQHSRPPRRDGLPSPRKASPSRSRAVR
jgi:hypothetical protein